MSGYPAEWSRTDIDGAVAALAGAGVRVTGSDKRGRAVDFVLAGRPCRLSQYDAYGRGKWVRARFPWPARWPDILLTDPDDPDEVEVIATGGLAPLLIEHCETVDRHEPDLTLLGLRLVYERNT